MYVKVLVKTKVIFILFFSFVCPLEINTFEECVRSDPLQNVKVCVGKQAVSFLSQFDNSESYDVTTGVVFQKTDIPAARVINSEYEADPSNFKSILDKFGVIAAQRMLMVDMQKIEPGLYLKIDPTVGKGIIEFVMDPSKKRVHRTLYNNEKSLGRVLKKQFLLPLLLGIKFHFATLVPIITFLMVLISKKAIFLLKAIIFLSNIFGYAGISGTPAFFPQHLGVSPYPYKQQSNVLSYNEPYDEVHENYYKDHSNPGPIALDSFNEDRFYDYEKELYQTNESKLDRHRFSSNGFKNIVWKSDTLNSQ